MRISDWSSDVCSSDLRSGGSDIGTAGLPELATWHASPQMVIMTGTNQREDGGRNDQLRLFLLGLGIFLILMAPVVGILPRPGGMLVLAAGLALTLQNSNWTKRRFVRFKQAWPRSGRWAGVWFSRSSFVCLSPRQ